MPELAWIWFALEPERNRLRSGEEAADGAEAVRRRLSERGLDEPLLVLTRERWEHDLAGGPVGQPERLRTAAELAALRAEGEERQLPTVSWWGWERPEVHPARMLQPRRPGRRRRRQDPHAKSQPERQPLAPLRVSSRSWTPDIVAVAVVVSATGEDLPGTRRLFADDDDGLIEAALWRGQLEFISEGWAAGEAELADD